MDGDTFVLKDLSRFYNIDLGDNVLGMCPEPTVDKGRREFLALREAPYHIQGVLLIDLKQWRNREIGKKLLIFISGTMGNFCTGSRCIKWCS